MRVFRCFSFVDMCGFTRMNDTLGDDEALAVLAEFRSIVRGLSPDHGIRVGKWLGDGCMFVGTEVRPVVETVLDLTERMENASIVLPLRIGIAAGRVIVFEGDDFIGMSINLASRLCDAAAPGEILANDEVVARARRRVPGHPAGRAPDPRHRHAHPGVADRRARDGGRELPLSFAGMTRAMTDSFVVRAGGPLHGTVRVSGATKNAGTKQMAAALLAPGVTTLRNVDPVADLDVMIDVLRAIGANVEWTGATELQIDASAPLHAEAPYELVTRMRASINVLGPLLARCGQARVAMPGGDNIGNRKLDMHFRGLEAMGVELDVVHGFIEARTNRLSGRPGGARVPERRRHREPAHRRGAGQGRDRHRERGPRAGDHRSRRHAQPHGRRDPRRGHVHARDRGRRGARRRSRARSWPTASRPARCSWRSASPAATPRCSVRASTTSRPS